MVARLVLAALVAIIGTAGIAVAAQVRDAQVGHDTKGLFYVVCDPSHRLPDDSIVFPGQPGRSHLHDFFGNNGTDAHSTPASLRQSGTTCHRPKDKAAYWTPVLYSGKDSTPVKPLVMTAFYQSGFRDVEAIQPFPQGLQVIAGDPKATEQQPGRNVDWRCSGDELDPGSSPPDSPRAQELRAAAAFFDEAMKVTRAELRKNRRVVRRLRKAVKRARASKARGPAFKRKRARLTRARKALKRSRKAYLDAKAQRENRANALEAYLIGGGTSIPTCEPGTNLILRVRFPDCWDGMSLDSADHMSHMAYSVRPRGQTQANCPRSHPVLMPILVLRVVYDSEGGPDVRLSPGDVDAGHADFVNAWDQEWLAKLTRDCLNVDKYCGRASEPHEPKPAPSPSPSPSPDPDPSPTPDPDPSPEPDPDPLPLPLP